MAKPFTLTLHEGVTTTRLKPGWYKRAAAAARAAATRRVTTAPQHGDSRADAKAIEYARWLAGRDGIDLPNRHQPTVVWEACAAGKRPRSVVFFGRPGAPTVIDLPHWDYVAPDVVEVELRQWAAPVVREVPAIMDEIMEAPAAIMEAAPPMSIFAASIEGEKTDTIIFAATNEAPEINEGVEAGTPCASESETPADLTTSEADTTIGADYSDPIPAPAAHFEAMAICPAVGMPCKVDCPHRRGCGPVKPIAGIRAPSLLVIAARALAARLSASAAYHARSL